MDSGDTVLSLADRLGEAVDVADAAVADPAAGLAPAAAPPSTTCRT